MALNGSHATMLPPARGTLSSSQLLSSSISSISSATSSRQASSQISKIYRQSSTLFLTRRLPESLSTILPVIQPPLADGTSESSGEAAPIVRASRSTRIKVWSLYLTILNAVLELDPDEGKISFGSSEYRALVNKVRDGEVWEEVVQNGYGSIEGDVDAEVVINLATLLLAHARTQKTNQTRLENYLAASTSPNLNITERLEASQDGRRSPTKSISGADTPRDLNARVKILELYTLHVLLRNNEWDYAREFITISEVLDEERREAFLQALQSLQDEQKEAERRAREEQRYQEELLQRDVEDQRRRREQEERERRLLEERRERQKTPSEIDYGVEDTLPSPSSSKARSIKASSVNGGPSSSKSIVVPDPTPPSSRPSKPQPGKPVSSRGSVGAVNKIEPTLINRASTILSNLRRLLDEMTGSVTATPMSVLRTLGFILFFLAVFGRRQVRERIRRVAAQGWMKLLQTAGMGVKVSYI